jgi:hypothetical protein
VRTGELLKLAALVVPLGLDTLGVSLALGISGLPPERRLRIGARLATRAGEAAERLAGVALLALGATLLADRLG